MRGRLLLPLAFLFLLALAIPWYWPADSRLVLWPGLPAWVLAAYGASFAISLLTALVLPRLFAADEARETTAHEGEADKVDAPPGDSQQGDDA